MNLTTNSNEQQAVVSLCASDKDEINQVHPLSFIFVVMQLKGISIDTQIQMSNHSLISDGIFINSVDIKHV